MDSNKKRIMKLKRMRLKHNGRNYFKYEGYVESLVEKFFQEKFSNNGYNKFYNTTQITLSLNIDRRDNEKLNSGSVIQALNGLYKHSRVKRETNRRPYRWQYKKEFRPYKNITKSSTNNYSNLVDTTKTFLGVMNVVTPIAPQITEPIKMSYLIIRGLSSINKHYNLAQDAKNDNWGGVLKTAAKEIIFNLPAVNIIKNQIVGDISDDSYNIIKEISDRSYDLLKDKELFNKIATEVNQKIKDNTFIEIYKNTANEIINSKIKSLIG